MVEQLSVFLVDGKRISVYYDKEQGMLLAYGDECRQHPTEIISWSDVEEHIYDMVESNHFLDAEEEIIAAQVDEEEVVTDIIYYFQDAFDVPKEGCRNHLIKMGIFSRHYGDCATGYKES